MNMNKSDEDRIIDEAIQWAQRLRGRADQQILDEFETWIRASRGNARHFLAQATLDVAMRGPARGAEMVKVLGYVNHETATIVLDIDNDRQTQSFWLSGANAVWKEAKPDGALSKKDVAVLRLSEQLEKEYEDRSPLADDNSAYGTLLTTALGRVDWQEVAEHLLVKLQESRR